MKWRVLVCVTVHPYWEQSSLSGERHWAVAEDCETEGEANARAWTFFQSGYSPAPGQIFRVDGTHVEPIR